MLEICENVKKCLILLLVSDILTMIICDKKVNWENEQKRNV